MPGRLETMQNKQLWIIDSLVDNFAIPNIRPCCADRILKESYLV